MKDYTNNILTEIEAAVDSSISKYISDVTCPEALAEISRGAIARYNKRRDAVSTKALNNVCAELQNCEEGDYYMFSFKLGEGYTRHYRLSDRDVYRIAKKLVKELPINELERIARSHHPVDKVYQYLSEDDDAMIQSCIK